MSFLRTPSGFPSFILAIGFFCIHSALAQTQSEPTKSPGGFRILKNGVDTDGFSRTEESQSNVPLPEILKLGGPLEMVNIRNSTLKRFRLSPWFQKMLRDEIYRRNEEMSKNAELGRQKRSLGESISKRQGLALGTGQLGLTPQQQQLILMQQQYQAAALLQQQMMSQTVLRNQMGPTRPYYNRYEDDDDSDSDEYDEFDSEEFMAFPIKMGFMPPPPGFRGKK